MARAKRRYINGKKIRRSAFKQDSVVEKTGLKPEIVTKKIITGSFGEGGGTGQDSTIILGGELGYKSKYGDISLKPSYLTEKSKHHTINKPDLKVKYSADFDQIKNIFKR